MKREVKIGIFAVTMIGAAWAGIRFLKGFDIFSRNVEYYAAYDQINGVQTASPIMMRGVKIGSVTGLQFDPTQSDKVVLRFSIKKQYRIPEDSEAKIFSNGLMGGKAIEILYGRSARCLQRGDTLRAGRDRDLMDVAGSELEFFKQHFASVTTELTRTLGHLNSLLERNGSHIDGTLSHLDQLSGDLAQTLEGSRRELQQAISGFSEFAQTLGENSGEMDSLIGNLNRFSAELNDSQLTARLAEAAGSLNTLLERLDHGEGTIGRLMDDPQLYDSVNEAVENLSALLADLKQYPARYVHLSVFGKNPDKMQRKAEKREAREEKKAAKQARRDSLSNRN